MYSLRSDTGFLRLWRSRGGGKVDGGCGSVFATFNNDRTWIRDYMGERVVCLMYL